MLVPRDFIDEMSAAHVGGTCQPVLREEFERAVDRGFGQTGDLNHAPAHIPLTGRDAPRCDAGHAKSPAVGASSDSRARGVLGCIRQHKTCKFLIATFCNSIVYRVSQRGISYINVKIGDGE
jgi:hypothetical protein